MSTQMAQEIAEQPEAVRRTLDALLPLRADLPRLLAGRRRVLFAARGTSDNAAIYGRYLLETHAGVLGGPASPPASPPTTAPGSTSPTRRGRAVSQSGATEEIVATQAWARGLRRGHRRGHQRRRLAAGRGGRPRAGDRRPGPRSPCPPPRPTSPSWSRWPRSAPRSRPTPPPSTPTWTGCPTRSSALLGDRAGVDEAVAALRDADVHRRVRARPDDGHRARDRAQARGDLPAAGARLLVRRPAPRPDLGGDRGDGRRAGGRARRPAAVGR